MIILGIDYGKTRTGLAISDQLEITSKPLKIITSKQLDVLVNKIEKIIQKHKVEAIVVGIPYGSKSNPTKQSKEVDIFIKQLKQVTQLPIFTWDETYSTKSVLEMHNNSFKNNLDSYSAKVILEEFLNHRTFLTKNNSES